MAQGHLARLTALAIATGTLVAVSAAPVSAIRSEIPAAVPTGTVDLPATTSPGRR